jgi:hypothetical protein
MRVEKVRVKLGALEVPGHKQGRTREELVCRRCGRRWPLVGRWAADQAWASVRGDRHRRQCLRAWQELGGVLDQLEQFQPMFVGFTTPAGELLPAVRRKGDTR